jgi:hypothetical protein
MEITHDLKGEEDVYDTAGNRIIYQLNSDQRHSRIGGESVILFQFKQIPESAPCFQAQAFSLCQSSIIPVIELSSAQVSKLLAVPDLAPDIGR